MRTGHRSRRAVSTGAARDCRDDGGSLDFKWVDNSTNEKKGADAVDATRCLRDEHQVILRVLDCFEIALRRSQDSGQVTRQIYSPFVEFFRGFADKCHHCKEEDRLFPRMEKKGIPREGGPIGVMLYEHQQARMHVRAIAEHLDAADRGERAAIRKVLDHGDEFLELLRAHISKEDHCLFGMADQVVQGADLTALVRAYGDAESRSDYRETFSRCRVIADELTVMYKVPKPQTA
jgi:hemerythrin-like domain-containing protein